MWHETQSHIRTEKQLTIVQETGNNILKKEFSLQFFLNISPKGGDFGTPRHNQENLNIVLNRP